MITITMPALSPTMEEGKLAKWHVKEGDTITAGDIIADIETDKATMEYESIDDGVIGKLLVAEGQEAIKINAPIAVLLEAGEDRASLASFTPPVAAAKAAQAPAPQAVQQPVMAHASPVARATAAAGSNARITASPLARRLAAQKGIDLGGVGAFLGDASRSKVTLFI